MSTVQIVQKTQQITVDPATQAISIVNAGPVGPQGAQGPQGLPGVDGVDGVGARPDILNVKDYGAFGNGIADDSAAFAAAFAAAAGARVNNATISSNWTGQRVIEIPAGIYRITTDKAMMDDLGIGRTGGLVYRGAGRGVTVIMFQPAADNYSLMYNNDDWLTINFQGIEFWCGGSHAATATWMKSVSTGGAQNYTHTDVMWMGLWQFGIAMSGDNNNSEMTWYSCNMNGFAEPVGGNPTAFLYAADATGSDQFVNYSFYGSNFECDGNFVWLEKGGNVNVYGGSYIHISPSADVAFFTLKGNTHSDGTMRIKMDGARIEHRNSHSKLIDCEWGGGSVKFDSCDCSSAEYISGSESWNVATFHPGNNPGPSVVFDNCDLMGTHTYKYGLNAWSYNQEKVYRNCQIISHAEFDDFALVSADGGHGNIGSYTPVKFVNCRTGMDGANQYQDAVNKTVGWHLANRSYPEAHVLSIRGAQANFPTSGGATAITNVSLTSNVATVTSNAHGYSVGNKVFITDIGESPFDGVHTITAVTTNTYSFAATHANISSHAVTGNGYKSSFFDVINLPKNAIITRVWAYKDADMTAGWTQWFYTLTDANDNQVAQIAGEGSTWAEAWYKESPVVPWRCSTDAKRTLSLTAAYIDQSSPEMFFIIEYVA